MKGQRRRSQWLVALVLAAGLPVLFGRAAGPGAGQQAVLSSAPSWPPVALAEPAGEGPSRPLAAPGEGHHGLPAAGAKSGAEAHEDALASAVQHISYRLERLDPSRLQDDPAFLQSLQVELATPAMPFVSLVAAQTAGVADTGGASSMAPPTLLVAFGPRFPETAGHVIATWDAQGLHLQVVDERRAGPGSVPPRVRVDSNEASRDSRREAGERDSSGVAAGTGTGTPGSRGVRFGLATIFRFARLLPATDGRSLEMVVVTERYPGSGSVEQGVLVLRRVGRQWHAVWSSGGPGWPGGAQRILVAGDGSWLDVTFARPAGDAAWRAARPILVTTEGPAPTLMEQRWERRGDGYGPVATRPLPQPLTLLVEFIRRVSQGQQDEAAGLVRDGDPELVRAGARWLTQRPLGQGWLVEAAGGAFDRGPLVVTRNDGQRVTVSFGRRDAQPLPGGEATPAAGSASSPRSVWIENIVPGAPQDVVRDP